MKELLMAAGGGAVAVSLIESIRALVGWFLKCKEHKEKRAEEKEDKKIDEHLADIDRNMTQMDERLDGVEDSLRIQKKTNMFILYDRLRYLAKCYIADGEISFEDRETWNAMHDCYHENGGNGIMKPLSEAVNALPNKKG